VAFLGSSSYPRGGQCASDSLGLASPQVRFEHGSPRSGVGEGEGDARIARWSKPLTPQGDRPRRGDTGVRLGPPLMRAGIDWKRLPGRRLFGAMADKVYVDNNEATAAWNTVLFDRFSQFRQIFVVALKRFGDVAIASVPPQAGDRILDVGCGFGDTAQQLATVAGPTTHVIGVDAAERFIEAATEEAAEVENVEFRVADVQTEPLGGPYDYAFARMGTMFFANAVAAMCNVRQSLRPGATLVMVVWQRKLDKRVDVPLRARRRSPRAPSPTPRSPRRSPATQARSPWPTPTLLALAREYQTASGEIVAPASAWIVSAQVPDAR
jgi:SAM-dependent methyltransferase